MADPVAAFLQICLGLFAENAGEWMFHRYILHGLGKRPRSIWNYHLSEHHRVTRSKHMLDPGYKTLPVQWNSQGKEVALLLLIVIIHLPVGTAFPWYVFGVYAGITFYYLRHRRSHLDGEWAASHLPWHYEHHLSVGVEANWCITWPWFDWIMATRVRDTRGSARHQGHGEDNTDGPN